MDDENELLDLVDQHDNVIGTVPRSQKPDSNQPTFLRAAEMLIRNKHGELWIPRRQEHKKIAPGGLDYSASGHVAAGETYIQALTREVKEELNLQISPEQLKFVFKFPPTGAEKMFFRSVYLYFFEQVPQFNTDDFSEYYWLTPKDLLIRLENGEPAKRSLQETVQYLVDHPA